MDTLIPKVPLKEFFFQIINANDKRYSERFDSSEKAVSAALAAAKEAVTKAEVAAEKRFESVNEFRNTLSDQQRNLMPRAEIDILVKALNDRADSNENRIIRMESKGVGTAQGWGYAVGVIGLVAAVIAIIFRFSQ